MLTLSAVMPDLVTCWSQPCVRMIAESLRSQNEPSKIPQITVAPPAIGQSTSTSAA